MPTLFVSYRRADAAGQAGRLADRLRACFGRDSVFRDYEAIELGKDFDHSIHDALRSCAVFIPVIGRHWADATDENGQRRLDQSDDYVRKEIAYALEHDVTVMPVLVDGATMPTADRLPDAISALCRRQMHELREARWDDDVTALMRQMQDTTELTADCPELATRPPWRDVLSRFFHDLLQLHASPVRFQSRMNTGRPHEMIRALVFFAIAVLVGDIAWFGSSRWDQHSWVDVITGVLSGIPVWFVVASMLAFVLWMAWWLVGARRHFLKVLINTLYQTGFMVMLILFAFAVFTTGIGYNRPTILQDILDQARATPYRERAAIATDVIRETMVGPLPYVALVITMMILLVALVWIVRAWGGHRIVLQKRRWQSLVALVVTFGLLVIIVAFPAWLGMVTA